MIDETNAGTGAGEASFPGIVLRAEAQRQFTVTSGVGSPPFDPFPLPRVPVSLLAWCGNLAAMLRERHGRCLSCLLTLHSQERRWTRAIVPPQRCESRRSFFGDEQLGVELMPPQCVVAGSSQSALLAEPAEASWLAPSFDGLHVVDDVAEQHRDENTSHCFVRAGGVLYPIGPEFVIFDDWVAALRQHADRLTFE